MHHNGCAYVNIICNLYVLYFADDDCCTAYVTLVGHVSYDERCDIYHLQLTESIQ